MDDARKALMKDIEYRVNLILEDAEGNVSGPINWADISVASVDYVQSISGDDTDEFYRVNIEEASPEAYLLQDYVSSMLVKDELLKDLYIEIKTEW